MTISKQLVKNEQIRIFGVIILLISLLSISGTLLTTNYAQAASTNLLVDGSFEGVIDNNWSVWKANDSLRTYDFFRSLSVPFGNGSYSAAIQATAGTAEARWQAGLATKASFTVATSSNYYLTFYAKSDSPTTISAYLENSSTYAAITPIVDKSLTSDWQRYVISFPSNTDASALLTFTFGDLAQGNTIYLDGVQLFKSDAALSTTEVKGYIGDKDRIIMLTNIENYLDSDVQVELPYYDNLTSQITTKRFSPKEVTAKTIKIDIYQQTFSGVGSVYINNVLVGNFNYVVLPRIWEINPALARANEDLNITGSGFHPDINAEKTYLIVQTVTIEGKTFDTWVKPHTIDSKLSEITATLPVGIKSGRLYVQTSAYDKDNKEILNKSNSLKYQVKPVISSVSWSKRGYEQVGDNIIITGQGISDKPTINFYDKNGIRLESKKARLVEIYQTEKIEVDSTKKLNVYNVTVTSGGVESDIASAINFTAGPRIAYIKSLYRRTVAGSNTVVQAGKIGDQIIIYGDGMKQDQLDSYVEFQGTGSKINVPFDQVIVDSRGNSLKVNIPAGAQNGLINLVVNGQKSNTLPLEIVPTVNSYTPDPIQPGSDITILANGVGSNLNLTTVYFMFDKNNEVSATPSAITYENNIAHVVVKAPMAVSSRATTVGLMYDKWRNNGVATLNANPTIISADTNLDNKILTIKGYGFSLVPKENIITYKLADESKTVVTPRAKILGVYSTEEGQEIRVQLSDAYYYGYVTVKVGDKISNEANFGPVSIKKIVRRVEFVKAENKVMGVLYISGYNFGSKGGVKVGDTWATVHYRTNFFIIAVVDQSILYNNPVIVAKE